MLPESRFRGEFTMTSIEDLHSEALLLNLAIGVAECEYCFQDRCSNNLDICENMISEGTCPSRK